MHFRYLAALYACAALTGCNQISAGLTPTNEKVNAAFPLPEVVKTAYGTLISALDGKPLELKAVTEQYARLMGVRALSCTSNASIGRFDTVSKIKAKVIDLDCFQKQDVRLSEWISLQHLSFALSKPALVALSELPPKALLPNFAGYSGQITIAAEANVMVVKGAQRFFAVQLPSGKAIHNFPIPEQTYRPATLSANGHVLAVPVGSRNLRMIEVETGNLLWSTEEYSDLIAWLPQVQAALLTQVGNGSPQILDVKNGTIDAFPSTEKRLTWALPAKAANGKYLVGAGQTVSQMDITRSAQGALEAAPTQQWRINGNINSSSNVFLMVAGTKLIYQSGQDLAWLDLSNQQQGLWQLSAISAYGFVKLSESLVAFDASTGGTRNASTQVLNIEDSTVATAKNMDSRDGTLVSLAPRTGYLKRSESSVTLGTVAEIDSPQALDKLVSDALLAKQLAKLANEGTSGGSDESSQLTPYHQALAKQVRAGNVMDAIRAGLPRDVIEAMREGTQHSGNSGNRKAVTPLLSDLPSNAKVTAIGVYEGTLNSSAKGAAHAPGSVRINVQRGSTPLVLLLSSYEPVH